MLLSLLLRPLHHGGSGSEDLNALQRLNDSVGGVFTGSFMHTVGAMLFTAGIIAFVVTATSYRAHKGEPGAWQRVLPYAQWATGIGVVLNGIGGTMRLYQSDHPSITSIGDSLWVQVLFVKHLFLFAGVGFAVWVMWKTRAGKADEAKPDLGMAPQRVTQYSVASFVTIILATVLGAVAAQAPMPMPGGDDAGAAQGTGLGDSSLPFFVTSTSRGTLAAAPPGGSTGEEALLFTVPAGVFAVFVDFSWTGGSPLDNSGDSVGFTVAYEDGSAVTMDVEPTGENSFRANVTSELTPGTWSVTVSSDAGGEVQYVVKSSVQTRPGNLDIVEDTVTIPAGSEFFELNFMAPMGAEVRYDWSVVSPSDSPMYFDIHFHADEGDGYYAQGDYASRTGNFSTTNENGFSFMWANAGGEFDPVDQEYVLKYRIEGEFMLHSVVGP